MSYEYQRRVHALSYFTDLISYGFFFVDRVFKGCRVRLKSLTNKDFEFAFGHENDMAAVALAVYSVNGIRVYDPDDLQHSFEEAIEFLNLIPDLLVRAIIIEINEARAWIKDASFLFEEFLESDESALMWAKWKACNQSRRMFLQDEIGDSLYPSEYFLSWHAYNDAKDKRQLYDTFWQFTKVIASASNPKLGNKLPKSLYRDPSMKHEVGNKIIPSIKTDRDLVEQLRRFVRGEKDEHDLLIEQQERQWEEEGKKAQEEFDRKMAERNKMETSELITSSHKVMKDE